MKPTEILTLNLGLWLSPLVSTVLEDMISGGRRATDVIKRVDGSKRV